MSDFQKLFFAMSKSNRIYFGEEPEENDSNDDKLRRSSSHYDRSHDENSMQFFSSTSIVPTRIVPKPSRESSANALSILAKSIRISDIKMLRPIPLALVSNATKIMRIPPTDDEEKQMVCDLEMCQTKVAIYDRIQAFDLSLIIADYQYFIRNDIKSAIKHLQKAAHLVPHNTRLCIEIYERAQELSEEIQDYESALQIDKKLDNYDVAFDWKQRRAKKKLDLKEKIEQRESIF